MILEAPAVQFGLNPAGLNAFLAGQVGSWPLQRLNDYFFAPRRADAQLGCSGDEGEALYHVRLYYVFLFNGEKLNTGFIKEFAPRVLGRAPLSVC